MKSIQCLEHMKRPARQYSRVKQELNLTGLQHAGCESTLEALREQEQGTKSAPVHHGKNLATSLSCNHSTLHRQLLF